LQRKTATSVGVVSLLAIGFVASWITNEQSTPKGADDNGNDRADVIYLGSAGVVFQSRSNTCGVAALLMVLDHFGIKSSRQEMEQKAELHHGGTSLMALKELAKKVGVEADGWRLSFQELAGIELPAILFVEKHHFIVVDSVNGSGILFVRDPAVGRLAIPRRRALEIWKGETLVITHASR